MHEKQLPAYCKYLKLGQYSEVLHIVNTFVYPTHCFRYTKIVYDKERIGYHI